MKLTKAEHLQKAENLRRLAENAAAETLQSEFTLPHGERLKRMARIGLAIAKAQQEAEGRPDAAERMLQAARDAAR